MYCNYCGKVIQDDANICAYCGVRVGGVIARKRLVRPRVGRAIAGVCAGVAEFLGWSPRLVRVLWVILTPTTVFAGGVLYLLLWLLMPEA